MAFLRNSVQVATTSSVSSNSQATFQQAFSSTGTKIAGAFIFSAVCLVAINAEASSNKNASTNASPPASVDNVSASALTNFNTQTDTTPPQTPETPISTSSMTSATSTTDGSADSVRVTVNGQDVPVTPNGTTQQTTTDTAGNVTTQIQVNNQSTGTNTTSTSTNIVSHSFSTGNSFDSSTTFKNGRPVQ